MSFALSPIGLTKCVVLSQVLTKNVKIQFLANVAKNGSQETTSKNQNKNHIFSQGKATRFSGLFKISPKNALDTQHTIAKAKIM